MVPYSQAGPTAVPIGPPEPVESPAMSGMPPELAAILAQMTGQGAAPDEEMMMDEAGGMLEPMGVGGMMDAMQTPPEQITPEIVIEPGAIQVNIEAPEGPAPVIDVHVHVPPPVRTRKVVTFPDGREVFLDEIPISE